MQDAPSWPPASQPYEAAIKSRYCPPGSTPMTRSAMWPWPRWQAGIDRSDQTPIRLTDDLVAQADIVVTLKPGLDLPHHEGVRYETWPLPDPG